MQDVASVVQAEMAEVEAQEMQLGEELQLSLCLPGKASSFYPLHFLIPPAPQVRKTLTG